MGIERNCEDEQQYHRPDTSVGQRERCLRSRRERDDQDSFDSHFWETSSERRAGARKKNGARSQMGFFIPVRPNAILAGHRAMRCPVLYGKMHENC